MIYLLLFFEFFKVGLFCFGGAFGMIPLIEETVVKHGWMTESEFYSLIGVCESTPGPIAVNTATYVGSTQGGLLGSIMATLGVVLPSFLIILLIAAILKNLTKNPYFKGFIKGVKPVVTALILSTGLILLAKNFGYVSVRDFSPRCVSIVVFALVTLFYFGAKRIMKKKPSSILLILTSAALGIVVSLIGNSIQIV